MNQTGELIVIEGIDGAGKTTVSRKIRDRHGFKYMKQPEDTWVGDAARRALHENVEPESDLFLHMAAHANQQKRLKSQLSRTNVVMDRYYHSRIAYQSVNTQFSAQQIESFHKGWSVEPSKTIIIDIPPNIALKRKPESDDKFEELNFLSEVSSTYQEYFKSDKDVTYVDGTQSKKDIYNEIEEIVVE